MLKNMAGISAIFAAMAGANLGGSEPKFKAKNLERTCLNCGKMHTHNNSFCSPDCCKLWKDKQKLKYSPFTRKN